MNVDREIKITLTSRLYADELAQLQERVGSVVPLKDPHRLQSIQALGLECVYSRETAPDYVHMFSYLSQCTLAILDGVTQDTITLTKLDPTTAYQIKNVYKPFFQWDQHSRLVLLPPIFGRETATVPIESNGIDVVFPILVPFDIAQMVLQRLLLHNVYERVNAALPNDVNMAEVRVYTTSLTHLGRNYRLDFERQNPAGALNLLDNLAMYISILCTLLPRACLRLVTSLLRYNEHELLDVFRGVVPDEINRIDLGQLNVNEDMTRMGTLMTYLQTVGSIFNLGPCFRISVFCPETQLATCWLSTA
ncbi:VP23 like capsid [Eptesicus fuscus gammaherpesvirus]|uniref:VP23 like capsid n=1 Tax=vespertilionid gammaherpesvirus 3 TaxID=2846598 RepID=A0A2D1AF97_9GAMA|nr:VP23 like capsid [Eptesicus fuscus gammaherpesvirus]ATA58255.1 VP23 like capsid [Eptesicus fuscus gammaherpesvirus]WAH70918.1 capsid protein [Eptesicus fuscus gammaherpesvirus]